MELRERNERLAASEHEKRERRLEKERAKMRRTRTKRRAAFVLQIKHRIGLGRTESSSAPK